MVIKLHQINSSLSSSELNEIKNRVIKQSTSYEFITSFEISIKKIEQNQFEISLKAYTKRGTPCFSSYTGEKLMTALSSSLKKIKTQLNKYKVKHYKK